MFALYDCSMAAEVTIRWKQQNRKGWVDRSHRACNQATEWRFHLFDNLGWNYRHKRKNGEDCPSVRTLVTLPFEKRDGRAEAESRGTRRIAM